MTQDTAKHDRQHNHELQNAHMSWVHATHNAEQDARLFKELYLLARQSLERICEADPSLMAGSNRRLIAQKGLTDIDTAITKAKERRW